MPYRFIMSVGRLIGITACPTIGTCKALASCTWRSLSASSSRSPRYYVQGEIIDDHYLSGKTTCLKLLAEGELLAVPQYSIPDDVAADVTLRLDRNETKPSCSICYELVKENARWSGLYLEKNLQVLAHHMKTKYVLCHACYIEVLVQGIRLTPHVVQARQITLQRVDMLPPLPLLSPPPGKQFYDRHDHA